MRRVGTGHSESEGAAGHLTGMSDGCRGDSGGTVNDPTSGHQADTACTEKANERVGMSMEEVVCRENMRSAFRRVLKNRGAPGVDGVTVDTLRDHLWARWSKIREQLLSGTYHPQPVLKVEIPKPGGRGMRMLGIPTVLDRLIQQAVLQVMQPHFDSGFSESSYGFRPGRSAHDAVLAARSHIASGRRWVVDIDLKSFFDRVNHDVLMGRLARKIRDKRLLLLIRRYLQAGMMEGGVISPRVEGTPQGGPLSPLLSNILLDELDKELERRGHTFVRYADDCNIYVRSKRAGERVLSSIERFLRERLRLVVNREKSAVDRPWKRTFLGYSVENTRVPKLRVAGESVYRFKGKLCTLLRRGRGRSLDTTIAAITPLMRGWVHYFRLSEGTSCFEDLDGWIRRKLRCILWKHWKRPSTRAKKLIALGIEEARAKPSAYNGRGPWWNAGASHMAQAVPTRYLTQRGLVSLSQEHRRLMRSS